jgi:hypothetical protein
MSVTRSRSTPLGAGGKRRDSAWLDRPAALPLTLIHRTRPRPRASTVGTCFRQSGAQAGVPDAACSKRVTRERSHACPAAAEGTWRLWC